jgi:site-specific recombinase XerD
MDVIAFSNQSRKTEETNLIVQRNLVGFFGDTSIESLSFSDVRNWKLYLEKIRGQNTVRGYVICLRVVLRYLHNRGLDVLDPSSIPVPKREQRVPGFITKEDVALLIRSSSRLRSKGIIALLYSSGIRISELISLNREDIKDDSFTVVGKGGKARLCFVDERAKRLISSYLATRKDNHPALFISQYGSRMSSTNIQMIMKVARTNAGITSNVTPHTLRHSFATNLLRSNMNMRYVQELLGHASLQTTQMYTHVVNEDLKEQYQKHHSL